MVFCAPGLVPAASHLLVLPGPGKVQALARSNANHTGPTLYSRHELGLPDQASSTPRRAFASLTSSAAAPVPNSTRPTDSIQVGYQQMGDSSIKAQGCSEGEDSRGGANTPVVATN